MEVKIIEIDQNATDKHITYYLGDVHEGAANFAEKQFKKAVKMIETDADAWIGLGDYIDCINYHDKRFNPHEISEKYNVRDLDDLPKRQSDVFMDNIKTIKDKCLGLLYGNHEDTYKRYNSFDVVDYMCKQMNITNLRHKAWIQLSFIRGRDGSKRTPIKIVAFHGRGGGGMREGYPINKVYDASRWDFADVHIMGHLHQMTKDRSNYNRLEFETLRKDPVWFAVNGCFLLKSTEGNDGYFEQSAGKESGIGLIKQTITPAHDRKDFNIELETIYL